MPSSATPLSLSVHLQLKIIENLALSVIIFLQMSCNYFNGLVKPLTHMEFNSVYGHKRNVDACRDCLRLLPASKFRDNTLNKHKRNGSHKADRRFCAECGINPQ
ncbi:hypothetical protein K432DRAFT_290804 [Lepidopterella palustris CBS 459.81]|uniref:Uncharacterized protein n=1 Tax=Lepidopterella palustris CBS 459.81 TaxID=1314670 RepID=A0A8E2JI63_9PEZI|nr:hypothetical protein K432DRAFT_290804 [Lepidopterella palustris CBS 459.81]